MDVRAFQPVGGQSVTVVNAVAATTAVALAQSWDTIVLTNTSSTAISYVRVTQQQDSTAITGDAPTTTADMPILPLSQIRIFVGIGLKVIRTIASAADGNIIITPGSGI